MDFNIFDRNGRLLMDLSLLGMSGSRPGFLRIGLTDASLKAELMTERTSGQREAGFD